MFLQDMFTGTVSDAEKKCVVAKVQDGKLERYDAFEVMYLSPRPQLSLN
jgi:hypothetical protein